MNLYLTRWGTSSQACCHVLTKRTTIGHTHLEFKVGYSALSANVLQATAGEPGYVFHELLFSFSCFLFVCSF